VVVDLPGHRSVAGNAPDDLLAQVPDLADRDVFVCGPDAWAQDVGRVARAAGLPEEHLHVESFRW
jgi:ferredoxin-NADP reductase